MFQQDAGLSAGSGPTDATLPVHRLGLGRHDRSYTRQQCVADIVETLTSGSGCGIVLVGEHGAGKSFTAQRALEELGDEYLVVQVRGSSISSKLPYGALSVLLNDLDASHLEHPLMVLRGLTQLLHTRAEGRRVVLFVDNAHDLDDLSSMMVAQLSAGAHVRLLAACVDMPHVGGDIMGLWKDDLLRRIDLGPFDFAESSATLQYEYGGRFSFTAARALWSASGGNALFLHALAREQIKLGSIVRHDGMWVLGSGGITLTGEIRDVVKARLNRLGAGQRDVFELLALAGGVPLQTLMGIANPHDMDALQERGMIMVSHDHPPMVSIANPVTAGIVASVVPPGRSAELRHRLTAVLEDSVRSAADAPIGVAWALDCGEDVLPATALAAARRANEASDPVSALRFVQEVQRGGTNSGASVESVRALLALNDDEAARRTLNSIGAPGSGELSVADWASLELLRAELDGRSTATKGDVRGRLREIAPRLDAAALENDAAAVPARSWLRLAEAELAASQGRYDDVLTATAGADTDDLGTEAQIAAASLRAEALAVTGSLTTAFALGQQVNAASEKVRLADRTIRRIRGRFLLLLLISSRFKDAAAFVEETCASGEPQTRLGGMFEIGQGVLDVHAGRLEEALSRLQAGMWQIRAHDPDALGGLATAACAYAAALQGDEDTAGRLLTELAPLRTREAWLTDRMTRYFELSAQAELGQRAASVRALVTEADADADASALMTALAFLAGAARLGDRQISKKLGAVAGRVSGPFADLCTRLADGMREADSEQLLLASKDADAAGNAVFARDAARKAVSCANDAGNRIALRVAQRAQQSLDDRFGSPKNGLHSLTTSTLTARECEVAVRAAAGTSNRKIAEQMHVSVRTVEGHLYQVYSKLHVASRTELKDVISTPADNVRLG